MVCQELPKSKYVQDLGNILIDTVALTIGDGDEATVQLLSPNTQSWIDPTEVDQIKHN